MTTTCERIHVDPADCERRLREGRVQAARIIDAMKAKGVTVELFGSMRTGNVLPKSDIDLLIVDSGPMDPFEALYEIKLLEEGVPVDVTILDLVPESSRTVFLRSLNG